MRRFLSSYVAVLFTAVVAGSTASAAAADGTGTVQGHVRLDGPAPGNPIIRMGMDPMCASLNAGPRRPVQQIVVSGADGGLANVFVTVKGTVPKTAPPSVPVVIRQVKCVDTPRVVGVMVGQTLRVVNGDTLAHETHAVTEAGNSFKVTQPHSDMVFDYVPKHPEEMLRLACDIHRWMVAYVAVEPHPYFSVTNGAGQFTIAKVPAGHYQLRAWHERYGWLTKTVDVQAGATATVDFTYAGTGHPPVGRSKRG
jgi:hypothetical protein